MTVLTKQGPTFVVFALALALAASAFLMSPGTSVAETHDSPRVLIEPRAPESASPGQHFSVEVWSVPGYGAEPAGWDFNVGYDRDAVHVLDVQPVVEAIGPQGHDTTPPCAFAWNDHGEGVAIAMACNRVFPDPIALVEIRFEIREHVSVGESVAFDIFDATVGDFGTPTSFIDSWGEQATVHIFGGICGDQNGDGKVNILDAITDFKFVAGEDSPTDLQRFLSDLDGNGEIDIIDVIIILQHIVGLLDIAQIGCGPREDREGSIYGYKFNDLNMNGLADDGEPPMAGWRITLSVFQEDGTLVTVDETVTMEDDPSTPDRDETGLYWFDGLFPGEYVVREERRDGWEQSWPSTAAAWMRGDQEVDQVETDAGGRAAIDLVRSTEDGTYWIKFGVEFGGLSSPTTGLHIHAGGEGENGEVLYDLVESSPSVSPGFESKVSGMFRLVDNPHQSDLSVQDQIMMLLNGGLYVNLHSEDHPGGEIRGQIWGMNGRHQITLSPGQKREENFRNYEHPADTPGRIVAIKFEDLNGNGVQDPGEPRVADVAIELFDSNGEHIETVRTMEDDPDSFGREEGFANFFDLTPGTYTVREGSLPDGWEVTTPTEVEVDVSPGTVKVVRFGNCISPCQEPPGDTYTIEGIKFEDRNGNGQRDNDEEGVSGVHIQVLDSGGNLVEEKWTDGDDPETPNDDETGRFRFVDLPEGEYTVREITPEGWFPTTPDHRTVSIDDDSQDPIEIYFGNRRVQQEDGFVLSFDFNFWDGSSESPTEPDWIGVTPQDTSDSGNYGWVRNEDFDGPCCSEGGGSGEGLGPIYMDNHGDDEPEVFFVQDLAPHTNYEVEGHFWWWGGITGMRISNANNPDQGVTLDVPSDNAPSDEENTRIFTVTSDSDGELRIKLEPGSGGDDTGVAKWWVLSGLEIRGGP